MPSQRMAFTPNGFGRYTGVTDWRTGISAARSLLLSSSRLRSFEIQNFRKMPLSVLTHVAILIAAKEFRCLFCGDLFKERSKIRLADAI